MSDETETAVQPTKQASGKPLTSHAGIFTLIMAKVILFKA